MYKGPFSAYLPIISCVVHLSLQVTQTDKLKNKKNPNIIPNNFRTEESEQLLPLNHFRCAKVMRHFIVITKSMLISDVE